jgi:hypothetical protein
MKQVDIPQEEIANLPPSETDESVQQVAQNYNTSPRTVVRKIKGLNIKAKADKGDVAPPPLSAMETSEGKTISSEPQVDYDAVAKSMIMMAELALKSVSMVSKGKIDYEPLSNKEIEQCTMQLRTQTKVLDMVNGAPILSTVMAVGFVGVTFMSHVKINKGDKKIDGDKKTSVNPKELKYLKDEEKNLLAKDFIEEKSGFETGKNIKPSVLFQTKEHQDALKKLDKLPTPNDMSSMTEEEIVERFEEYGV